MEWPRLLAYITGRVNKELLVRNEYLAAENRILRAKIKGRLQLSDGKSVPWSKLPTGWGRRPLAEVAMAAKPDTILRWFRKLVARKFDGRNHADAIVACDFMVAVTAKFQLFWVFVMLELGSRRILRCNVTAHPSAEWTLQQFRDGLSDETPYGFVIHDRDCIFSTELDQELVRGFGVKVLKTPPESAQANAFCERLIGTIRRGCLDFMILLNEEHLRRLLSEQVRPCNAGRPHSSLGSRIPADGNRSPVSRSNVRVAAQRKLQVISRPVLSGLHHEYGWKKTSA